MKLRDNEHLVDIVLVKEGHDIITVSEKGYGKRSRQEDYRTQGRYGSGVMAGVFNEQTGGLVSLKQITDEDDLMLICDDGQIIRLNATEINTIGRNTKGVRLMKVKDGFKIVAIAVVPTVKEEEVSESGEGAFEEGAEINSVETE